MSITQGCDEDCTYVMVALVANADKLLEQRVACAAARLAIADSCDDSIWLSESIWLWCTPTIADTPAAALACVLIA
jgi:hypothetical protein